MVTSKFEEEVCMSTLTLLLRSGTTEAKIRTEIKSEAMGSTMFQPNCQMRIEEMITLTLPRASARICKNMPVRLSD